MLPSSENVVRCIPPASSTMDRRWKPNIELAPNCPRCDSSSTKFCYYNNYSLTQPRYFCKGCRRYWTKGGSLRNVPVGGGCRKNRPRGKVVRPVTNITSDVTRLPDNFVRPDVILNDPSLNGCDGSVGSSSEGSAIDLAVLYAKFSNPDGPGFESTGQQVVTVPNELTVENLDFSGTMSSNYQTDLDCLVDCQSNFPSLPTMDFRFRSGFLGSPELDDHFDFKTAGNYSCGSQLLSVDESVVSGDVFLSNYSPRMTSSSIWQQQQHPLSPSQNQFGFVSPVQEDTSSVFNTNWINNMFDSSC